MVWPQNHSDDFHRFGLKTDSDGFSLVWASKPMATVCEWFGLKTTRMVFTGLASKPVVMVSHRFGPQNRWLRFVSGLASKPLGRFLPVWPQNQWRRFLAGWPQNLLRRSSGLASKPAVTVSGGLASKPAATVFSNLASKLVATVSPGFGLKTGGQFLG
jgi:hypothetical protein